MDYCEIVKDLQIWLEMQMESPHLLTIDCVAKKSGYSKWHLQRIFRGVTGVNLGRYIRDKRLNMASVALRHGELDIIEIAILYGFDSQASFTRSFKKKFGHTPAKYRKTYVLESDYSQ